MDLYNAHFRRIFTTISITVKVQIFQKKDENQSHQNTLPTFDMGGRGLSYIPVTGRTSSTMEVGDTNTGSSFRLGLEGDMFGLLLE